MPGTFVTIHQQRRICRGKLEMADPIRAMEKRRSFSGVKINRESDDGKSGSEAFLHHLPFVFRLIQRVILFGLATAVVTSVSFNISAHRQCLAVIDVTAPPSSR